MHLFFFRDGDCPLFFIAAIVMLFFILTYSPDG